MAAVLPIKAWQPDLKFTPVSTTHPPAWLTVGAPVGVQLALVMVTVVILGSGDAAKAVPGNVPATSFSWVTAPVWKELFFSTPAIFSPCNESDIYQINGRSRACLDLLAKLLLGMLDQPRIVPFPAVKLPAGLGSVIVDATAPVDEHAATARGTAVQGDHYV